MTNIDPGVDMTWARTVPAFGTTQPIYPTFNPPNFDAAKAYEAANSVTAGKLANQIRTNEIAQAPVENAIRQADLARITRENRVGQSTEQATIDETNAKAMTEMGDAQARQVWSYSQMVDGVTGYIDAHPNDPAAIEEGAKQLADEGLPKERVDQWKQDVADANKRQEIHQRAQGIDSAYRNRASLSFSGSASALQRRDTQEVMAEDRAGRAAVSQLLKENAEATQEEQDTAYQQGSDRAAALFARGPRAMPATASPAAGAKPTVEPPSATGLESLWEELNRPGRLGADPYVTAGVRGGAALGASDAGKVTDITAAQKARAAELAAGPAGAKLTEEKPNEKKTSEQEAAGDGSEGNPYRFAGDRTSADAMHKWAQGLKPGEYFYDPRVENPGIKDRYQVPESGQ